MLDEKMSVVKVRLVKKLASALRWQSEEENKELESEDQKMGTCRVGGSSYNKKYHKKKQNQKDRSRFAESD
jgi:hypothetical protein